MNYIRLSSSSPVLFPEYFRHIGFKNVSRRFVTGMGDTVQQFVDTNGFP